MNNAVPKYSLLFQKRFFIVILFLILFLPYIVSADPILTDNSYHDLIWAESQWNQNAMASDTQIHIKDLSTGTTSTLSSGSGALGDWVGTPAISGNGVVWVESQWNQNAMASDTQILMMDLSTGTTSTLSSGSGALGDWVGTPAIQLKPVPVVLVHGWRGTPAVWNDLVNNLTGQSLVIDPKTQNWIYPYYTSNGAGTWNYTTDDVWIFDYSSYNTDDPAVIALSLRDFINEKRAQYGYTGKIDIICHSMGALVTRYYMTDLTNSQGKPNSNDVRQWIGVAPVDYGAAIANWIIPISPSIAQMRTDSYDVQEINSHPLDPNVKYRVLVGYNSNQNWQYFSLSFLGVPLPFVLFGHTLEVTYDTNMHHYYHWTYFGDGVVALEQSYIQGAGLDSFGMETHNSLPHAALAINTILNYLVNPDLPTTVNWPTGDAGQVQFNPDKYEQGIIYRDNYYSTTFTIDPSVDSFSSEAAISGSQINLSLISPSGHVIQGNDPLVTEYQDNGVQILYTINNPEPGTWTARIGGVDIPDEGESFTYYVNLNSSVSTEFGIKFPNDTPQINDTVTVYANISDSDNPVTGASVYTRISNPNGITDEIPLFDDGTHSDIIKNDGMYTNSYQLSLPGQYELTFIANGTTQYTFSRQVMSTFNVSVDSPPVASFTANVTYGIVPLVVQFTDTTTGSPTSWNWSFGDGGFSSSENPSHVFTTAGTYMVSLTAANAGGNNTATQNSYITVTAPSVPAPIITSISPTSGPLGGGTMVTISGTGFTGVTAVKFGTTAGTITVNHALSITATAPAHAAGTVNVTVTTPLGTSAIIPADQYTYQGPPTVTKVSLTTGPLGGGSPVTITGTNLLGATKVYFGGIPAPSYVVTNATSITATTPGNGAGTVNITVTTPSGTSATSATDQYTYEGPPAITKVSPNTGPLGGGTSVTITGTNLLGATNVYFGGTPATSNTVTSATSITAKSPAVQSGPVDAVTVITPSGTSAIVPADQFTYTGSTQSSIAVTRSMPATASPGANITVTLTPGTTFATSPGWGVTETLPAGWTFVSTTADGHSMVGGAYQFAELSTTPITYTVTAPPTRGAYTFNGTYIDGNKGTGTIVGAVSVTVVPNPLQTYDANHDGYIEKFEAITAVTDYLFNGTLSKADCVTVITAYLFHTPVT